VTINRHIFQYAKLDNISILKDQPFIIMDYFHKCFFEKMCIYMHRKIFYWIYRFEDNSPITQGKIWQGVSSGDLRKRQRGH
jgi:hypothetical protein